MSDKTEVTVNAKGLGDEILKGVHAAKSYVGSAWITLLLYYVGFFIVGLIVNLVYLSKSKETMQITGSSPSGRGCLLFLLWTHCIIPIIILFMLYGLASLNM